MPSPDPLTLVFYTATSFGRDAVMIFFVLSGYFISGSILRDRADHRWSWTRYLVNRLARLQLVLIPGLLLTLFWDSLGLSLYGSHPAYTGEPQPWAHDFFPVADRFSVRAFLMNVVFLQMIAAPPFGSNDPLWSLSNEFWYYVLFPLALVALTTPRRLARTIVYLAIFIALLVAVGAWIAVYFPIWLFGTLVYVLPQIPALKRRFPLAVTLGLLLLFCGFVAATHFGAVTTLFAQENTGSVYVSIAGLDYLNGAAFALVLYVILHDQSRERTGVYAWTARELAGFSYTLYVVHIPVLIFLRAAWLPDRPWPAAPGYYVLALGLSAGVIVYAYAISRVTERRTAAVRDRLMRVFSASAPSRA